MPPGAPPGTRLPRPDNMGVQSLEIGGPHNPEVEAVAREHPEDLHLRRAQRRLSAAHRRAISRVARTAGADRRKAEVDQIVAHAERARERGDSFEEQIVVAIQAMLVSPELSVPHRARPGSRAPLRPDSYYLNDYELASRLSYFLWSSMPDDEPLMRAADQGTLRRPEVLEAQVQRMLKDPKIARFVENFGGQWLQFRALESHKPDFYKFPLWDNYLRISAEQGDPAVLREPDPRRSQHPRISRRRLHVRQRIPGPSSTVSRT